jgi:hypothetical protein
MTTGLDRSMHSRLAAAPQKVPGPMSGSAGERASDQGQLSALPRLRPSAVPPDRPDPDQALALVDQALDSPGLPLGAGIRGQMEQRLGADFGQVRIHADEDAAASAQALGAAAYTVGDSIVFAPGRYAPARSEGRELLAHELVHTIQQGPGGPQGTGRQLGVEPPESSAETEARVIARTSLTGGLTYAAPGGRRRSPKIAPSRVPPRRLIQCQLLPPVTDDFKAALNGDRPSSWSTWAYGTISSKDSGQVWRAYERLVPYQLSKLSDRKGLVGNFSKEIEAIKAVWNERNGWSKDKRGNSLQMIVGAINSLDDRLNEEEKGKGEKKEEGEQRSILPNPEAWESLNSRQGLAQKVNDAIKLLEDNRDGFTGAAIGRFFGGSGASAAGRIKQIIDLLRKLYSQTENGSNPRGFVVDPMVHEDKNAVSTGAGVTGTMRLHENILVSCPGILGLAVTLMHEGSHLIEKPTTDFAYRDSGHHLLLPAEMALLNAANYEEAVILLMGPQAEEKKAEEKLPEVEEKKEVKVLPPTDSMQRAAVRLAVQITRGWVIAQRIQESNRGSVDTMLDLPTASGTGPLAWALLAGLFSGVDILHYMVAHKFILEQLPPGEKDVKIVPRNDKESTIIRVPKDLADKPPAVLAEAILSTMCKIVVDNARTPLRANELAAFVLSTADLEVIPHIKTALTNYLK